MGIICLAHAKKCQNTLENSLGTCPTTALSAFSKVTLVMSVSGVLVNQKSFAKSWNPYLLEDMMAMDYTFLKEDRVFGYFANTHHLATLICFNTDYKNNCHCTHLALSRVECGFNNCTPISAHPLFGTRLLTT